MMNATTKIMDTLTASGSLAAKNFTIISQNITRTTELIDLYTTEKIILLILYTFILFLGLIGNSLVVCFYGFKTKCRKLFHYYLLHLAFADIIASVATSSHLIYNTMSMKRWLLGDGFCKTLSSIGPITVNVSAWIITSIAIERHRGINKPFKKRFGKCSIHLIMILIWILSLLTLIPYMNSMVVDHGQCVPLWVNEVHEFIYSIASLIVQSIIPIFMMMIIFASIRKTVAKRHDTLSVHYKAPLIQKQNGKVFTHSSSTESGSINQNRDKKLMRMLITAFTVFIICSLPYNIFYSVSIFVVRMQKIDIDIEKLLKANMWLSSLVVTNSCMNFFIYAGLDRSFMVYCKSFVVKKDEQKYRERMNTRISNIVD